VPIEKYMDFLLRAVRKRLNRLVCSLGLAGPKEAYVHSYSPGGANVPDDTLP